MHECIWHPWKYNIEMTASDPRYVSFSSVQVPLQSIPTLTKVGHLLEFNRIMRFQMGFVESRTWQCWRAAQNELKMVFLFPVWKRCSCCANKRERQGKYYPQAACQWRASCQCGRWMKKLQFAEDPHWGTGPTHLMAVKWMIGNQGRGAMKMNRWSWGGVFCPAVLLCCDLNQTKGSMTLKDRE